MPALRQDPQRQGRHRTSCCRSTVMARGRQPTAPPCCRPTRPWTRASRAPTSIIMQGIRSTMTLPLLHGGDLLGLMHLDSLFTSNAFTEKDLQICTGMAAQAAIAIQNARLASRIEKEAQTRAQISRLIPPSVVEQVRQGRARRSRRAAVSQRRSRCCSPTSVASPRCPTAARREEVVNTLNEYFEVMVDVLFKFTGHARQVRRRRDHRPVRRPHPDRGRARSRRCRARWLMLNDLEEFNRTRAAEKQPADQDRHRHQHRQRHHRRRSARPARSSTPRSATP